MSKIIKETCPKCGIVIASNRLVKHLTICPDRKFECNYCSASYKTRHDLNNHMGRHLMEKNKDFYCAICKKTYASKNAAKAHKEKFHSTAETYKFLHKGNAAELNLAQKIEDAESITQIAAFKSGMQQNEKLQYKTTNGENATDETEMWPPKWFNVLSKNEPKNEGEDFLPSTDETTSSHNENEDLYEEDLLEPISCLQEVNGYSQNKNKRRKTIYKEANNNKLMKALTIIQNVTASKRDADDCDAFAAHIAHKLRRYNLRTRNIVEHYISEILFKADEGRI